MASIVNPDPFTTRPEIEGTFGVVATTHWIATAVAIQWVDVTTPKVPSISGLVVNGSGLMLLIGIHCWVAAAGRAQLTTAEAACQPAPRTALLASL